MFRPFFLPTLALAALLSAGCDDAGRTAATEPQLETIRGGEQRLITMTDACDPQTFDAVLGVGACTRNGGVQFAKFLQLLGKHQKVGAWHFAPTEVKAKVGQELLAVNRGGEEHTFTEVEEFGGGIVPDLNVLAGVPDPAPECLAGTPADLVPPGGSTTDDVEEEGTELYQCCIHPWMRTVVTAHE
jgi:plastocyanin